jgi:ribosomal protein L11 methyltransferase
MGRSFVEISVTADPNFAEHLIGVLGQLGVEGFWEDEGKLRCYIKNERWTMAMAGEVETVIRQVARSSSTPLPTIAFATIEDQNWNALWEKTITPIGVTDRITIAPSWHVMDPPPDGLVLTIDPKMSFGTGYHESTRLALRLLERSICKGCRVLDVGTGTGILAIAAAKLGAKSAVGVDIDEWAYRNAKENAARNGVEHRVQFILGEVNRVPLSLFDVITANIQGDVIQHLLKDMLARLAGAGRIIVSGLLASDRVPMDEVAEQEGLAICDEERENEWVGLTLKRHDE